MKAKTILAPVMLLGIVAIAGAMPDQPNMQAARGNLFTARNELQRATADKNGHRANAIRLVNSAITEVNEGIAYDRRHNHASSLTPEALFAGATPDQPHMQAALDALENAKNNLNNATLDHGGYRAKAIGYVKDAISEVRKGIDAGRN
jgi:exopolyphosphatase/pppGpp-phosphohydrolase